MTLVKCKRCLAICTPIHGRCPICEREYPPHTLSVSGDPVKFPAPLNPKVKYEEVEPDVWVPKRLNKFTRIAERDNWICHLCGESVLKDAVYRSPGWGTLDHVKPKSQGGADGQHNLKLAHYVCNLARGGKAVDECQGWLWDAKIAKLTKALTQGEK